MNKMEAVELVGALPISDTEKQRVLEEIESGKAILEDEFVKGKYGPHLGGVYVCRSFSQQTRGSAEKLSEEINSPVKFSLIAEHIEKSGNVFTHAEDSLIGSKTLKTDSNLFYNAKSSTVTTEVAEIGRNVLIRARSCTFSARKVRINENALSNDSKDSALIADDLDIGGDILYDSENCYVISDVLKRVPSKVIEHLTSFEKTRGGAVVVSSLGLHYAQSRYGGRTTIIAEKVEGEDEAVVEDPPALRYITIFDGSDWKSFRRHVENARKSGRLDSLRVLRIERDSLKTEEDFDRAIEELDMLLKDVEENFKTYSELREVLRLSDIYDMRNSERVSLLRAIPKTVRDGLKETFGLTESNADVICGLENAHLFIKDIKDIKEKNDFIERFSNSQKRDDALKFVEREGLSRAYSAFERRYDIAVSQDAEKSNDSANEVLYRRGMEIIERIKFGSLALNPHIDESKYEAEKRELKKKLRDSKGKDEESKSELDDINRKIKKEKQEKADKIKENLKSSYSFDELKEELNQLSQHYLTGTHAKIAGEISKSMIVREGGLTSNSLGVSIWNKDIRSMPTYRDYRCCAFLGGAHGDSIFNYMANPEVRLVTLSIGEDKAIAITVSGKDKYGRKVMMVDSIESKSHKFERTDVVYAILNAMKDCAKESGFERLLYNAEPGNNVPRAFIERLDEIKIAEPRNPYGIKGVQEDGLALPDVYLEQEGIFLESSV